MTTPRPWHEVFSIMTRFMPEVTARIVLKGATDGSGVSGEKMTDLPRLLEQLRPGLRHFVARDKLEALLGELRLLVRPKEAPRPTQVQIVTEADAGEARLQARNLCDVLGGTAFQCQKVATGVSELARNQLAYAHGGTIELIPALTPRRIHVRAIDQGPGIPNLGEILSGTYHSKTGMGMGLVGVKRLADRFEARTGPNGTHIEFEVFL